MGIAFVEQKQGAEIGDDICISSRAYREVQCYCDHSDNKASIILWTGLIRRGVTPGTVFKFVDQ